MKKNILFGCIVIISTIGLYIALTNNRDFSEFQEGDLIFHTSLSGQSNAIMVATASILTHMGMIHKTPEGYFVIEAGKKVQQVPLHTWITRGVANRYTVYRHPELNAAQATSMMKDAKTHIGTPYDLYFTFGNDSLYCSELPYIVYQKVGLSLGSVQSVSELNIDNSWVEKIIQTRWQDHHLCSDKAYKYDECRARILNDTLVSPSSIANDKNLERIYSNYLFF